MAAETSSGTTTEQAQTYAGTELADIKADALLRDAARIVRDIAPPPSSVTDEYRQAASDSELRIFEILASGARSVKSESVGDVSVSYADSSSDIYNIVRDTMAGWIPYSSNDDGPGTVSFAEVNPW